MILPALTDYYRRRCADPDPSRRLPAFGLERKELSFILEIDAAGGLKNIVDVRQQVGPRKVGTSYQVPEAVKKTSGVAANLLWDNAEYVLGLPDAKKLEAARAQRKEADYRSRLLDMQAAFRHRIESLPAGALDDEGLAAVLRFLADDPAGQVQRLDPHGEIGSGSALLSFRLIDDGTLVCQRPTAAPFLLDAAADEQGADDALASVAHGASRQAICLVTGDAVGTARLHASIKGVWGAQTSGASLVSFNRDAFNSHFKQQGENAPVGRAAAFAYTTALNALLARGSRQRMQVGDASTVFWAQRPDPIEDAFLDLLGGDDDPDAHVEQVRALLAAVYSGGFAGERGQTRFFVLGLAPNAARLSVRFWHAAPLAQVAERVAQWFTDLKMVRGPGDPEHPTLFRLLAAVAVQGKAENIPPRLGGDVLRALFTGGPYPFTWLGAAVQRCRSERQVNHLRAAAIKAVLSRNRTDNEERMSEMLDIDHPSAAYRLGRLFATLEKIQEEASPGLNATIRERYYGAASSTPVAVFTTLLRLAGHHLAKLTNRGRAVNFEKLIAEIMGGISDFPAHLSLPDQGRFAIGYYHQRQDFYVTRREAAAAAANEHQEG